jgi:hypothetical protein
MDHAMTVLRTLPDGLLDRHWELDATETTISTAPASRQWQDVYMRPFDQRVDRSCAGAIAFGLGWL